MILKILLNSDVFIKRQTHDKNKVYKQKKLNAVIWN